MAKIVIAGEANSAQYARIDMLALELESKLPHFEVVRIAKTPDEWESYAKELSASNDWPVPRAGSAVVWREPMAFGGRRLLIGDGNDFQDMIGAYYGLTSSLSTCEVVKVAAGNHAIKLQSQREATEWVAMTGHAMKLCIIGAWTHLGYNLLSSIVDGTVFGKHSQDIDIYLHDRKKRKDWLEVTAMEIEDAACFSVRSVVVCYDRQCALAGADCLLILSDDWQCKDDSTPSAAAEAARGPIMSPCSWLNFVVLGQNCDQLLNENAKIFLALSHAGIDYSNQAATAMLRGIERADLKDAVHSLARSVDWQVRSLLARSIGVESAVDVVDIAVFGESIAPGSIVFYFGKAEVRDTRQAAVCGPTESWKPLRSIVTDSSSLSDDLLLKQVGERMSSVTSATRHDAVLSASCFIADSLRDLYQGNRGVGVTSLGVRSKGWYGVPEGMMFYMPVIYTSPGQYHVVDDLPLPSAVLRKIRAIVKKTKKQHCRLQKMLYASKSKEAAVDASALNEEVEAKIDANAKPDYGLHAKCRLSVLADDVDPAQARVCGL